MFQKSYIFPKHLSIAAFLRFTFPPSLFKREEPIKNLLPCHSQSRIHWFVWECYCWWKKSCTSWHVWNPVNNDHIIYHINWWVYRILTINYVWVFSTWEFFGSHGTLPRVEIFEKQGTPLLYHMHWSLLTMLQCPLQRPSPGKFSRQVSWRLNLEDHPT